MKFGIFSVVDHYPNELQRDVGGFYDELLDQAQAADELGFNSFWIAEHHFHEYGVIPRPAVWMAAAAQRTRNIRLGAAVVVLPFDNPLRIAEDYAMVDVLSGGRLTLGVGSGYLSHEFEGFGIDREEKRERFDEALEILLKAWSGERFSFEGKFNQISDIKLNITSLQRPHPEMHVAILSNQAAKFVGARGFPIMMIPYATTEAFSELSGTVSEFREAFIANGGAPEKAVVPFGLHCHCGADTASARATAREYMDRYVGTRLYAKQRPFDLLIEKDLAAFGSPEDVIAVAKKYEAAGLDEFLAIMNFGGMPHKEVLRSMERMAQEVIPAFQ